jgi:hypothetical protein
MISPRIDAFADSDIMPASRRKTLVRKRTMNFTARLNKILKATGITAEATWCNVVKSYTVWCEYHNGYETKSLCVEGLAKQGISKRRPQDEIANETALQIVDQVLTWESR